MQKMVTCMDAVGMEIKDKKNYVQSNPEIKDNDSGFFSIETVKAHGEVRAIKEKKGKYGDRIVVNKNIPRL